MARSLTVKQEEAPRTSLLFVTFVALCAGLLVLTWLGGAPEAAESSAPAIEAELP